MPTRNKARAADSDDDFIVNTEESSSEDDYESPSEENSEESGSPPPKPIARSSSRRQSSRALASPIRQRKEAQLGALEKLKSAREARETRKKSAPKRKTKPRNPPSPPPPPMANDDDEDSWSEREKAPPSAGKKARSPIKSTNFEAKLREFWGPSHKPNQLLMGHRDYTERGGGGGGGSYTDDEDLANFIASEGEVYSEDEKEDDVSSSDDEEAGKKAKGRRKEVKEKSRRPPPPLNKKKVKKKQHSSSVEEEEDDKSDTFDDDEDQHYSSSAEKRRLKLLLKPEVVIVSSSSESEEDSAAVLAATTAKAGASGVVNSSQSPSKRKRLRKVAEEEEEKEPTPPPSPRTLLELREKSLREALNAVTSLSEADRKRIEEALTAVPKSAEKIKHTPPLAPPPAAAAEEEERNKEEIKKSLRERPEKPVLTAAQRIAQAQAAFKAPYHTKQGENEASSSEEEDQEDTGEEDTPAVLSEDDDSEGSLRDLIVHDGEEELKAAGLAEGQQTKRTPVWQEAVETLRIGQRDDEDCFYDYVEYLLMCYVDPTYKARINESPEHKSHFQYSVRRIETKMTTARDAVHSEAWRSCSRGLLEAVEWLPGAQSNWDPDYARDEEECNHWDEDEDGERVYVKCAACNRKNSHATRTIIFKGRPRPPPEDETWEDVPANKKLSEKYLAASPVYKKKRKDARRGDDPLLLSGAVATAGGIRQGGGRRGFQLGFRGQEDDEYNSDDSLSRFIVRSRRSSQHAEHQADHISSSGEEEEEEGSRQNRPKADLPFDERQGPSGLYIKREFPVGRQCSARLMLYHGMFHWKHRLLARLKFELKEERRRRRKRNLPIDPGSVSDGVLSREPLKQALWHNFKELTAMGEAHQLAGGEIGNSAWGRSGAVDPHRQVVAVLAALHDDSDGEESDIDWGVPGQEHLLQDDDDDGGGGSDDDGGASRPGDRKRKIIAQMYKKQRQKPATGGMETTPPASNGVQRANGKPHQIDIRDFFNGKEERREGRAVKRRVEDVEDSDVDINGAGPGPSTQQRRKEMMVEHGQQQFKRLRKK